MLLVFKEEFPDSSVTDHKPVIIPGTQPEPADIFLLFPVNARHHICQFPAFGRIGQGGKHPEIHKRIQADFFHDCLLSLLPIHCRTARVSFFR